MSQLQGHRELDSNRNLNKVLHSYVLHLKDPQICDFILRTKRKIKNLPFWDVFSSCAENSSKGFVYVNEYLKPEMYRLLLEVKSTAKIKKFKYVRSRNGQIFAKKDDDSERIIINSELDLNKLD